MPMRYVILRRFRRFAAVCLLVLAAGTPHAQSTLQLGIFPYLPTAALLAAYEPLRRHLSAELGRPIEASTAPSYHEFAQRCLAGEYDLAVISSGL